MVKIMLKKLMTKFLAVQIETATGLENAMEIMSTDGIDGCWIGPFDPAASMGVPLNSSGHLYAID